MKLRVELCGECFDRTNRNCFCNFTEITGEADLLNAGTICLSGWNADNRRLDMLDRAERIAPEDHALHCRLTGCSHYNRKGGDLFTQLFQFVSEVAKPRFCRDLYFTGCHPFELLLCVFQFLFSIS